MAGPDERPAPARPGPIGGDMAAILWGVARRFQLPALEARHSKVWVLGLFALVNGLVSIAIMAAVAVVTRAPFIFPSLGPTAFLLFYAPTTPAASPRNSLGGHLIGCLAGYLALVVFGLTQHGPALAVGVQWQNVGAAALSLGLTSGAMVWCRVPHPRPWRVCRCSPRGCPPRWRPSRARWRGLPAARSAAGRRWARHRGRGA